MSIAVGKTDEGIGSYNIIIYNHPMIIKIALRAFFLCLCRLSENCIEKICVLPPCFGDDHFSSHFMKLCPQLSLV